MSHAQLLQLARQRDTEAITTLLNQCLQLRRVTLVEVKLNENCLNLKLVSPKVPNQYKLIPFLRDEISSLEIDSIETVQILALTDIESAPAWETSITLEQDWSTAQNLAEAVVRGKRSVSEESEAGEILDLESSEKSENAVEDLPPIIETIEENLSTKEIILQPIQTPQKPAFPLLPLASSFLIGLLTGLSIGYFFSPQKNSVLEPTIYTTPEQ